MTSIYILQRSISVDIQIHKHINPQHISKDIQIWSVESKEEDEHVVFSVHTESQRLTLIVWSRWVELMSRSRPPGQVEGRFCQSRGYSGHVARLPSRVFFFVFFFFTVSFIGLTHVNIVPQIYVVELQCENSNNNKFYYYYYYYYFVEPRKCSNLGIYMI